MKLLITVLASCTLALGACDSKSNVKTDTKTTDIPAVNVSDGDYGTAVFIIDGKSYTGKISKQTFSNNNYSIVCQQDEPMRLIQITFKDEAAAKKGGSFKPTDGISLHPSDDEADINIDAVLQSKGKGTVEIKDGKLTLKDISCSNISDDKTAVINTAEIKLP